MRKLGVVALAGLVMLGACRNEATDTSDEIATTRSVGGGGGGNGPDSSITQPPAGGAVASITVTRAPLPDGRAVQVGDSLGFSAVLKDAAGVTLSDRQVAWTSSNTGVVRMDGSFGNYSIGRAAGAGSADVSASSEGKTGSVTVSVH
jgi:hypothetical protein